MLVDQKHITTVRMHDAKGSDVQLVKEADNEYHLRLTSRNNMVNITLGSGDLRKLCQQLIQLDIEENWKPQVATPPEFRSFLFGNTTKSSDDNVPSWFARMAGEMVEAASKR